MLTRMSSPAAFLSGPTPSAELEAELSAAATDFDRGDYLELSAEQLERCIATGESPWPDESPG